MPRRPRHFLYRGLYVTGLLLLLGTAWLRVTGTQIILNVGDMARFGTILFQILAVLQLALVVFFAALGAASNVSQEKDRRTLILLLLTRMTNSELVLGKLMASLLSIFFMIAAALPVFMLITLFGGVSFMQVARVIGVTLASALVAGSLGSTLAVVAREDVSDALNDDPHTRYVDGYLGDDWYWLGRHSDLRFGGPYLGNALQSFSGRASSGPSGHGQQFDTATAARCGQRLCCHRPVRVTATQWHRDYACACLESVA